MQCGNLINIFDRSQISHFFLPENFRNCYYGDTQIIKYIPPVIEGTFLTLLEIPYMVVNRINAMK